MSNWLDIYKSFIQEYDTVVNRLILILWDCKLIILIYLLEIKIIITNNKFIWFWQILEEVVDLN